MSGAGPSFRTKPTTSSTATSIATTTESAGCRPRGSTGSSFADHVRDVFVVFLADALDELPVGFEIPREANIPRLGVGLGVVDRHVDADTAKRCPGIAHP